MRELSLQITGVEPAARGLTPLLHFKLHINASPATEPIQAVLLNAQVQLECPQRSYTSQEKEKLLELFGTPERWGQTLRNRLWTHANTTVGAFTGSTDTILPVQCTYDLNLATAKYFYALESGEVPLLFLFSGSVFYVTPEGRLQVEPISWNTECSYQLPVQVWRELMEKNYPNRGWVCLQHEVFERLYAYKRQHGLATWEQTIELLLDDSGKLATPKPELQAPSPAEVPV
jgi:hypothetical protein